MQDTDWLVGPSAITHLSKELQLYQRAQASDCESFSCSHPPDADVRCRNIHLKYHFWRRHKLSTEHASQTPDEGQLPLKPSQVINAQLLDAQPQPAGLIKAVRNRHVEESSPHVPELSLAEARTPGTGFVGCENSQLLHDQCTDWWAFL